MRPVKKTYRYEKRRKMKTENFRFILLRPSKSFTELFKSGFVVFDDFLSGVGRLSEGFVFEAEGSSLSVNM